MLFLKLNDGRTQNLLHISTIQLDKNTVIYNPAKGSLTGYIETFDDEAKASSRYEELKAELLV